MRRRSYTQLSMYQQCPESYYWKYVERIPEEPAVWSVGGTAFHTCAEWFLTGTFDEQRVDEEWERAWRAAYQEVIDRNPAANPDVSTWRAADRGRENAAWWAQQGPEMVRRFIEWKRTTGEALTVLDDEDGRLYLEARLEVDFGGVPVLAIPDALVVDEHGQVDIVDYKTGKPPKNSTQLGVYAAVVREALGLEPAFGLYYMARAAQLISIDLAKHPHDRIVEAFVDFDTREKAGEYPPTPGEACRFCPFKSRCSAFGGAA